jgi:hypothetical protein
MATSSVVLSKDEQAYLGAQDAQGAAHGKKKTFYRLYPNGRREKLDAFQCITREKYRDNMLAFFRASCGH